MGGGGWGDLHHCCSHAKKCFYHDLTLYKGPPKICNRQHFLFFMFLSCLIIFHQAGSLHIQINKKNSDIVFSLQLTCILQRGSNCLFKKETLSGGPIFSRGGSNS